MFSASWRRLFKALLPVPLSIFHPWNINAVFPELFFKGRPLVLGVEISEAIDLQVDPGHSAREPEAIPGWCAENLPKHKHPSKPKWVSLPGEGSFCSISRTVFFSLCRVPCQRKQAQTACYYGWPFNPSTQTLSTTMAEPIRTGQSSPPSLVGLSLWSGLQLRWINLEFCSANQWIASQRPLQFSLVEWFHFDLQDNHTQAGFLSVV